METIKKLCSTTSKVPIEGVQVKEVGEDAPRCRPEPRRQQLRAGSVLVVFAPQSDVSPPERGTLYVHGGSSGLEQEIEMHLP